MTIELKLRLYVSVIVVVMATLYVTPFMVTAHWEAVRQTLFQDCLKEFPTLGFSFCWGETWGKAALPFWEYLLPFLPAGLALWINWLVKPDLRLSEEAYPKRTINVLLWLGLLVAAVGVWVPFSEVISRNAVDLHKIADHAFWRAPWVAAAWLVAPIIFHQLLAPESVAASMRKGRIALWLLAFTPVAAFLLYVIRMAIRDFGSH